jgi:hypothetical protein
MGVPTPVTPTEVPSTTTSVPFFQTTTGRGLVKAVVTAIVYFIPLLFRQPALADLLGSIGGVGTLQSIARDLADPSIPN